MSDLRKNLTVRARRLFAGQGAEPSFDMLIYIEDGLIASVFPADQATNIPADVIEVDTVCPGFIDIQINGARDVQFNSNPTVEGVREIATGAREGGTAYVLPTFITAPDQDYLAAISAVKSAIENQIPGVLGVHLEGPFLSKKRPGIHPSEAIRTISNDDITSISTGNAGVVLLTLAPEDAPEGAISRLTENGVIVFAGHTAATADQISAAEKQGLRGLTHLFNAMSQIGPREIGAVGSALASKTLYAGIIVDGLHVHKSNLSLAAKNIGSRLCIVTDAMQSLAGKETEFDLYGKLISLKDGKLTDKTGTLAGAHLAMDQAVRNMIAFTGISDIEAIDMASSNPASALKLADQLGAVKEGYRASLTILDKELYAKGVLVDGQLFVDHEPDLSF